MWSRGGRLSRRPNGSPGSPGSTIAPSRASGSAMVSVSRPDGDELARADRHRLRSRPARHPARCRSWTRASRTVQPGRLPVPFHRDDAVRPAADVGVGERHVAALPADRVLARADRHHQARVRPGDHADLGACPAAPTGAAPDGLPPRPDPGTVADAAARPGGQRVQPGASSHRSGPAAGPAAPTSRSRIAQPGQRRREIADAVLRLGGDQRNRFRHGGITARALRRMSVTLIWNSTSGPPKARPGLARPPHRQRGGGVRSPKAPCQRPDHATFLPSRWLNDSSHGLTRRPGGGGQPPCG